MARLIIWRRQCAVGINTGLLFYGHRAITQNNDKIIKNSDKTRDLQHER